MESNDQEEVKPQPQVIEVKRFMSNREAANAKPKYSTTGGQSRERKNFMQNNRIDG